MLTVLVVAHEFGHYIVGRSCGFGIEEFAVGFGPKLFSRVRGGIRYSVRALPLGGFVQFTGEDQEMASDPRAFNNRPIWQRFLTLLAGPGTNVVFAFLLTVIILTAYGDLIPVIQQVEPNSPAYEYGIQPGDVIVGVDGKNIDFYSEFQMHMEGRDPSDTLPLVVERKGEEIALDVPFAEQEDGSRLIGISYGRERSSYSFFEAIGLAFKWMYFIVAEMFSFLGDLIFRGQGVDQVAGPVGTITIIGQAVRSGFEVVLRMASLLSINLAVMNLLPFPALDGGRLVFLGVEKLRGKPIPRDKEGYINLAGMIVLFILMALLTYQDIARLITGG